MARTKRLGNLVLTFADADYTALGASATLRRVRRRKGRSDAWELTLTLGLGVASATYTARLGVESTQVVSYGPLSEEVRDG